MAISNLRCPDCRKYGVCKWFDILDKFDPEKKNVIRIDLEMVNCEEFQEVQ